MGASDRNSFHDSFHVSFHDSFHVSFHREVTNEMKRNAWDAGPVALTGFFSILTSYLRAFVTYE